MFNPNIKMFIIAKDKKDLATGLIESKVRYHVEDKEDLYEIYVEMPGIERESLKIYVSDKVIRISGEPKKKFPFLKGPYRVSINLDETINSEKVKAKYEDGILTITAYKREMARRIPVE